MYELSLACRRANQSSIQYIYDILNKYITQNTNVIITRHDDNVFCYILFACNEKKKDEYDAIIKQAIISYIINVYKCDYLKKNIKISLTDDFSYDAYIKVLSLFDKSTDENILDKLIVLNQSLFIDSFIEFRMTPLIAHWNELCDLAKDNSMFFLSSSSFIEIIRFLVNSMDTTCKKIKILCKDGVYSIYSVIEQSDEVKKVGDSFCKLDLISQVLTISPMNIDVYVNNDYNDEALGFLSDVYTSRLKIYVN